VRYSQKANGIFGAISALRSRVDFSPPLRKISLVVHRLALALVILLSLGTFASAKEKKRFVLYATMIESTPVQLADGARWQMDKGDTFPVIMFKEQQTRIVLQLAGTSFITDAVRVKVIEEKDLTEEHLSSYRANVNNYIESRAEKLKAELGK
jgi:hypothetical protein